MVSCERQALICKCGITDKASLVQNGTEPVWSSLAAVPSLPIPAPCSGVCKPKSPDIACAAAIRSLPQAAWHWSHTLTTRPDVQTFIALEAETPRQMIARAFAVCPSWNLPGWYAAAVAISTSTTVQGFPLYLFTYFLTGRHHTTWLLSPFPHTYQLSQLLDDHIKLCALSQRRRNDQLVRHQPQRNFKNHRPTPGEIRSKSDKGPARIHLPSNLKWLQAKWWRIRYQPQPSAQPPFFGCTT